jgi:hypothetical protein
MVRREIRSIVLHSLPSDEETHFDRRESVEGSVAYVSGEGRCARVDNSPKASLSETPTPELREMLRRLVQREWRSEVSALAT